MEDIIKEYAEITGDVGGFLKGYKSVPDSMAGLSSIRSKVKILQPHFELENAGACCKGWHPCF